METFDSPTVNPSNGPEESLGLETIESETIESDIDEENRAKETIEIMGNYITYYNERLPQLLNEWITFNPNISLKKHIRQVVVQQLGKQIFKEYIAIHFDCK